MRRVDLELSTEIELSLRMLTRIQRLMTRHLAVSDPVELEELVGIARELSEGIEFAIQQRGFIRLHLEIAKA
jgi:hypothetical protein